MDLKVKTQKTEYLWKGIYIKNVLIIQIKNKNKIQGHWHL